MWGVDRASSNRDGERMTRDHHTRNGLILGVGTYTIWGLLPLYLRLLQDVPALQVLAHRVVWSLLLLAVIVFATRRLGAIRAAARGRTLAMLMASATLIAVNWLVYIWSIQNGHVLEASLGYFIIPLVNVALGMAVLGERITRVQAVAVGIAALGVAVLAIGGLAVGGANGGGGAVWIPLILAASFASYGLIRKVVAIDALGGLTVETALLLVPALVQIVTAQVGGTGALGQSRGLDLLLVLAGVVTAVPLLMFAAAARRLRYSTLGLLQYIAPTLQFLEAVLIFHEPLRPIHLATFALIWTGCAVYAVGARWAG